MAKSKPSRRVRKKHARSIKLAALKKKRNRTRNERRKRLKADELDYNRHLRNADRGDLLPGRRW